MNNSNKMCMRTRTEFALLLLSHVKANDNNACMMLCGCMARGEIVVNFELKDCNQYYH